jgi:hypothetical protein
MARERTGHINQTGTDRAEGEEIEQRADKTMLSRNQPWNWTKEEDERLKALVAQGASVVKAAAALKRKIVSVRARARTLGCPFPPLRVVRGSR